MSFTDEEIAYMRSQPLARVATVSADGQPDAVPVGFEYDGTHIWIGGIDPGNTRRARNIRDGNTKVAIIIDDLASTRPWSPRYLRIYGDAELVERPGLRGPVQVMKVTPRVSWSINLDGKLSVGSDHRGSFAPRKTIHHAGAITANRSPR
ncbi:PPOX class F420-dependent oxidoreductase [Kribbella sp. NPDC050124]|uniref:PPOX class F420-dependent oxidoreductase n=1 Tax=Kribbella sp. NPDC050124 TaxID=3364114 RepID=UPI00378852A8